jgi:hypothetical protein
MAQESLISLHVKCPMCENEKKITVPAYVFENKAFGALKIQIPKGGVCTEHQFVIYVDKKGNIRSYETTDYQLPSLSREKKERLLTLKDFVGMVGIFATLNVIHALFLDLPIILVQSKVDKKMEKVINITLNSLFPGFFKNSAGISVMSRTDYTAFQDTENHLAIDEQGYILLCPWEINKFEIEEDILKRVLELSDFSQQTIVFQQLLTSFFRKLNFVGEMLLKQDVVYEDELKEKFKKHFIQKRVSNYELELIKAVLENRFKKDVSKIKIRSYNKLKESLW